MRFFYKFIYWYFQYKRYRQLTKKFGLIEKMVDIGNQNICYHISPKGTIPFLYIHGLLDASFGFRKVLPLLKNEIKVYLIDIPSFGKSKLPSLKILFQIDLFAEMIYRSIEKLDLKNLILSGHSMGGLICQYLCLIDQKKEIRRISKVILLAPGNSPHERRDEMRSLLFPRNEKEVSRLLDSLYFKEIPEPGKFIKNTLVYGWNSKEYHYLAENTIEKENDIFFGKRAKEIKIPTLIVSGENDEITPVRSMKNLNKWIKGSRLKIVPNTKHAIHLEGFEVVANEINIFGLGK